MSRFDASWTLVLITLTCSNKQHDLERTNNKTCSNKLILSEIIWCFDDPFRPYNLDILQ